MLVERSGEVQKAFSHGPVGDVGVSSAGLVGILLPNGYCWRISFKPFLAELISRRRPDGSGLIVFRLIS